MRNLFVSLAAISLLLMGWRSHHVAQSQSLSPRQVASRAVEFKMDEDGPDVIPIAFSPDGHLLAGGDSWNQVRVWDAQTGQLLKALKKENPADNSQVESVAFSPDGKLIASGSKNSHQIGGRIFLWNAQTGQLVRKIARSKLKEAEHPTKLAVAFSPDDKTLASSEYEAVRLWETASGRLLRTLRLPQNRNWNPGGSSPLAFSPDGRFLAAGNGDGVLQIWNLQTLRVLRTIGGYGVDVSWCGFTSDSRTIVVGKYKMHGSNEFGVPGDGFIELLDTKTWQRQANFGRSSSSIDTLALSPDNQMVAAPQYGDQNLELHVWNAQTGQLVHRLQLNLADYIVEPDLYSVAFSPDGKRVACGGNHSSVTVWTLSGNPDRKTGQP